MATLKIKIIRLESDLSTVNLCESLYTKFCVQGKRGPTKSPKHVQRWSLRKESDLDTDTSAPSV